jgi:hypothetical protein
MRDSIREGMKIPLGKCKTKLQWQDPGYKGVMGFLQYAVSSFFTGANGSESRGVPTVLAA